MYCVQRDFQRKENENGTLLIWKATSQVCRKVSWERHEYIWKWLGYKTMMMMKMILLKKSLKMLSATYCMYVCVYSRLILFAFGSEKKQQREKEWNCS